MKGCYRYTADDYSAVGQEDTLPFVTTAADPDGRVLCSAKQANRERHIWTYLGDTEGWAQIPAVK